MVKQARAATPDPNITFRQATAEDLPFADDSFNVAFSTLTFHHSGDQVRQFPERSTLDPMLSSAGLSIVAGRRVLGFGGQLGVLAIAARPAA